MNLEDVLLRGTRAAQPLATTVASGTLYYVTDQAVLEQSVAGVWLTYSTGSGSSSLSAAGFSRPFSIDGEDGVEGFSIPGPRGLTGPAGASGSGGGLVTPALFPVDGEDGQDSYIVGPRGLTGATGATGSSGAAGGGGWGFITSNTPASTSDHVDFTGLSGYRDILVLLRSVTISGSQLRYMQVSTDNGVSWLGAVSDYLTVPPSGIAANGALGSYALHVTNSAAAVTCWVVINLFNTVYPKIISQNQKAGSTEEKMIIPTASPLDAIRIIAGSTFLLTGGTIYLFGRT